MRCLRAGRLPGRHALSALRATDQQAKQLGDRGTLWTFTTQNFRPPSPPYDGSDTADTFRPYALGYIELPGELSSRRASPSPTRRS
ncbi:OB-fold domain-containing protein [Streptomyces sp. KL116D]|uniref:OB-fold domain-containing protein n=1 Tax=Streptomyces sp. KL116D TaxID=3045152 RepID=UPI003557F8D4